MIDQLPTTLIRPLAANNQPAPPMSSATVVDVTDRNIGLRVDPSVDVTPNRMIELELDGTWNRGRIVWSRTGVRNAVIASIELAETAPAIAARRSPAVAG